MLESQALQMREEAVWSARRHIESLYTKSVHTLHNDVDGIWQGLCHPIESGCLCVVCEMAEASWPHVLVVVSRARKHRLVKGRLMRKMCTFDVCT